MRAVAGLLVAVALVGCKTQSGVQVTVTATGVVHGVSRFHVTVVNLQPAKPLDLTPDGAPVDVSSASPQRFTLLFDPDRAGPVDLTVEAVGAAGTLATGHGSTTLVPGQLVPLTVALEGGAAQPDMATTTDGGGALPDLAEPDLATVDLAVKPKVLSFAPAANYATTVQPYALAAADFNGDGHLDLINTSYQNFNITPFQGNGDGTFNRKTSVNTGTLQPSALTAADFNGDGKPDVAVVYYAIQNGAMNASVWAGNGSFGFTSLGAWATAAGPFSVAAGDLNGDGKPDIAVGCEDAGSIVVLLNNGNGTMAAKPGVAAGMVPRGVAIADLDKDGAGDVAVAADYSNNAIALLGNGNGGFVASHSYPVGMHDYGIAIGDVDGDGRLDLVAASQDTQQAPGSATLLRGNGDGTFQVGNPNLVGRQPRTVAINDFDGDGRNDIAVANTASSTVSILINQGNGAFAPAQDFSCGSGPWGMVAADFNGDGRVDIAVSAGNADAISVLMNTSK